MAVLLLDCMLIDANYGYPQATAGEETAQIHLLVLLNPQHSLGTLQGTEVQDVVLHESWILDTEPMCQGKGKAKPGANLG